MVPYDTQEIHEYQHYYHQMCGSSVTKEEGPYQPARPQAGRLGEDGVLPNRNVTLAPPVHPSNRITLHLNDATFSNAASHPCF